MSLGGGVTVDSDVVIVTMAAPSGGQGSRFVSSASPGMRLHLLA